jgi:hypothetical protein
MLQIPRFHCPAFIRGTVQILSLKSNKSSRCNGKVCSFSSEDTVSDSRSPAGDPLRVGHLYVRPLGSRYRTLHPPWGGAGGGSGGSPAGECQV